MAGGPLHRCRSRSRTSSRLSTVAVTLTFNPALLRVRVVQEGSFMRQGGATVSFTQQIDATRGRVDITVTRTGTPSGASGSGMLAALVFDAVAPGTAPITVSGAATAAGGAGIALQFTPAVGGGPVGSRGNDAERWIRANRSPCDGFSRGYTFVELLVVTTIILILASAVMPLAQVTIQRQREGGAAARRCARCGPRSTSTRTRSTEVRSAAADVKLGSEGLPARPGDARRRRHAAQRRDGAQAEVPAAHARSTR